MHGVYKILDDMSKPFLCRACLLDLVLCVSDSATEKESTSIALLILFLRSDCHLGVKLKTIQLER